MTKTLRIPLGTVKIIVIRIGVELTRCSSTDRWADSSSGRQHAKAAFFLKKNE